VFSRAFFLTALCVLAACGSGTVRPGDDVGAVAPAPSPANTPPVVDIDPGRSPSSPVPQPPSSPPENAPDTAAGRADSARAGSDLELRRIGRWISSGIKGTRRLVIRDPATWSRFWAELGAGVRPQVDFGRDLVIAVASGERSSGGHDIAVQRVAREGGQLRIEVLETTPGPGCMSTSALTQPVDVVVVPSPGVEGWSFIDRTATGSC
jgi:hypothetical protein